MKLTFKFENKKLQYIFNKFMKQTDAKEYMHMCILEMNDRHDYDWTASKNTEFTFVAILLTKYIIINQLYQYPEPNCPDLLKNIEYVLEHISDEPISALLNTLQHSNILLLNDFKYISNPTTKLLVKHLTDVLLLKILNDSLYLKGY